MRVYATELKQSGEVVLIEWASIRAFEHLESWVNPAWVNVATSKDLLEMYCYPYDEDGFIVRSEVSKIGYNLMHEKALELRA
jgi:hypothetical protein